MICEMSRVLTQMDPVDINLFPPANPAPEGLTAMQLHAYVNFDGTCRQALDYYTQHLGAKVLSLSTFEQMPNPGQMPPGFEGRIMHARFELANATVMASDGPPGKVEPMRSAYLSVSTDTDAQAEQFFEALSDGGQVFMPIQETFFASRFAMLRDRFGINWMLIHERPMPSQR